MVNKENLERIVKEYNQATAYEIWEGIRDNFIFGFLGATVVVFISTKVDTAVLIGYVLYYYQLGRIQNRPRYVTNLGKLIVFPIPSALGAFTGYKMSYLLEYLIKTYFLQ